MAKYNHYDTLQEAIDAYEKLELNYRALNKYMKMHDNASGENLVVPIDSIINKYRDFLSSIVQTVELTDAEWLHLRFRPKSLSYRLYRTTEFWHALVLLNNCKGSFDFDLKTIKIYDTSRIFAMINEIMVIEGVLS